jgi:peptidoglycan/xylan/chitin deacetylase (PgdA/CDA1 family)
MAQNFPVDAYEVIVVVDGSTDGTLEMLSAFDRHSNLRILSQLNRGQAAAINAGIRAASGDVVLFLDDDILCGANVVAEHARASRTGTSCLAFGPVLVSEESGDPLALAWVRLFSDDFFAKNISKSQGWYGCMACANSSAPRSLLLDIGGLDESFTRGNDADLGYRLLQAGYCFNYLPECVTHQIFMKSRAEVIKDANDEGVSEIRLYRKHPALRPRSRFARMSSGGFCKRSLIRALATAPFSAEPLLRIPAALFWYLRWPSSARAMALRLFRMQQSIEIYRAGVKMAGSWKTLRQEFGQRLPILMYHSIGPLRAAFDVYLTVSEELFERHLKWIRRHGYTPIRISDWIAYRREGKPLPEKPILLTFDDAYRDLATYGLPLLCKYGFTGTVFVVTDQIGGTNAWDLHLGLSEQPLMSEDEIREWARHGIEFGAHTRTHADLTKATPEEIAEEMRVSRQRLEDILGMPVSSLAYPYGYYTAQIAEVARQHFDAALTCDRGMNDLVTDLLCLRRSEVVPFHTWGDMRSMTLLGFNLLFVGREVARSYVERFRGRLHRFGAKLLRAG